MHQQLRCDGIRVGRERVERLMAAPGQGAFLRRGWRGGSTRRDPGAASVPGLVNRQFIATTPIRLCVADVTRISCGQGVRRPRTHYSPHRRLVQHPPHPMRARRLSPDGYGTAWHQAHTDQPDSVRTTRTPTGGR
ncbi:hypothetical protein E1165_21895 [Micromonospora sp. KC723]|nr:hypothetical protein [Micromonospora sp. KC723]TDB71833.1 hypothetical protein E1165_21895 [Micromonospora sp. KC723]